MSKIDQGPAASSFESPTKVGWLYKHGGSGVSSHWRKRWFVADHHYLFYYKGPNDKKPVGIVCLPEYESCHKAEVKVWKKQHSFVLDRGNSSQENDSSDGSPAKNYVLYADSEEDMIAWIKALSEEIKPMIGEDRHVNGFSGGKTGTGGTRTSAVNTSSSSSGTSKGKGKKVKGGRAELTVDNKVLDQVTAMAGEGPKLTHLTASRPKIPRGRRPPKRYAVFHEDDSRPEESPPDTPDLPWPSEPSPPSESPTTQKKKGHKPSVALLPNRGGSVKASPKTPPTPPAKVARTDSEVHTEELEAPNAQKLKFKGPLPPKKPVKEKPATPVTKEEQSLDVTLAESPRVQRPTPPSKPNREKETIYPCETTEVMQPHTLQQQQSVEDETKGSTRPSPARKPRPQPPVKPRTNTMAFTASVASGDIAVVTTGVTAVQSAESSLQRQQSKPVPAKRPVPRKRTAPPQNSVSKEVASSDTASNKEPPVAPEEEEKPSTTVKESAMALAEETTPLLAVASAEETSVSVKEEILKPEREAKVPVEKEEPVVEEKETKTASAEDMAVVEKEDEPNVKIKAVSESEAEPAAPVVSEKEEKQPKEEGKEETTLNVEIVEDIPKEKVSHDVEAKAKRLAEPDEQLPLAQDDKKTPENVVDDVYEIMEGGKTNEAQDKKETEPTEEYEVMSFNPSDEEDGEKKEEGEKAIVSSTTAATTETQTTNQHLRETPTRVHQYAEVGLTKSEQKSKNFSLSRDVDGTSFYSAGYEHMKPAPVIRIANKETDDALDGEYVPMKDGVMIDKKTEGAVADQTTTDKYEYEIPGSWVSETPPISRDKSPPYDSLRASSLTPTTGNSPSHRKQDKLAQDADLRRSSVSSTASASSQKSDSRRQTASSLEVKSGRSWSRGGEVSDDEKRRRGSSGSSKKSVDGGNGSRTMELDRDSLGYAKVLTKDERVNLVKSRTSSSPIPPEIIPMSVPLEDSLERASSPPSRKTVPESLQQAKEVLRLARVVKAEAEQMREEARKELSIAKRDRHEAMILKKNAAEILRMAKERLGALGGGI